MNRHISKRYKIAIIHDSLQYFGGAERALVELHRLFPDADVYTSVIDWKNLGPYRSVIRSMHPHTSFVQRFPIFVRHPYLFRYFLPVVWAGFDLRTYDLVISCSYSQMAHLVHVPKGARHIIYSFAPPRHLYGYETDFPWEKIPVIRLLAPLLNRLLIYVDKRAVLQADAVVSESREVAKRFLRFYGKVSEVLYPPVSVTGRVRGTSLFQTPYYLSVARLSRRKHIDVIIRACNTLGARLVVVGVGPERRRLEAIAGPTVLFAGNAERQLPTMYAHAQALICAGTDEDFGLVAVEAISFGTPVIAPDEGGYKETVSRDTGILVKQLNEKNLTEALRSFRPFRVSAQARRKVRKNFGTVQFRNGMRNVIFRVMSRASNARI